MQKLQYIVVGAVIGIIASAAVHSKSSVTTESTVKSQSNLSVQLSPGSQVIPSNTIGVDQLGAAAIGPKRGDKNSNVQSTPTSIDQIIGNTEIKVH